MAVADYGFKARPSAATPAQDATANDYEGHTIGRVEFDPSSPGQDT
jgi:hypothetical protein